MWVISEAFRKPMVQCYFCFITSEKGLTCQNWTSNQPHQPNFKMMKWLYSQGDDLNHNFCRIADPQDPRPWCYTTNPNVRFDYCDCSERTTTTTAITTTNIPVNVATVTRAGRLR